MSKLPPTLSELAQDPVNVRAAAARMNGAQRRLFQIAGPIDQVRALIRTDSLFDVGLWFRSRHVWVAGMDDRLAVFADGPRPYLQVVAYPNLYHSFYTGMSGELVLLPAPELALRIYRVNPNAAQVFLSLIKPRPSAGARSILLQETPPLSAGQAGAPLSPA